MGDVLKLNLGAGVTVIEGFAPVDRKLGTEVYPLAHADNSVDEMRASHILEHFSHRDTVLVLRDWVRALKPGGLIKVAVPNLDALLTMYEDGASGDVESYLMGGHLDANDVHLATFNEEKLRELMTLAGLVDIAPWRDEVRDCAIYPFSLNLQGRKPEAGNEAASAKVISDTLARLATLPADKRAAFGKKDLLAWPRVGAVMSVPRLGFMDNFFCMFEALVPLHIPLKKVCGAYWGQCLERGMEMLLTEHPALDYILTLDYDTVFKRDTPLRLIQLMREHPEADAIAPVQCHRSESTALMTMLGADGKPMPVIDRVLFDPDVAKVHTAHFGLTLIRISTLKTLPHPWFCEVPGDGGRWGANRTDADIWFWREWAKAGHTLYLANRIVVGHAELMIRWPDINMQPMFQSTQEFGQKGPPEGVWK